LLADYQATPASLGMWSGPTAPDGVIAEVVELQKSSDLDHDLDRLDVKGKLVLTAENPAGFKWLLARKGALGAINAFTENPDLRDGRQWINAWGDNGWAFIKGSTPLLCFSISPRQADYLRGLLRKGPVRVKAKVAMPSRWRSIRTRFVRRPISLDFTPRERRSIARQIIPTGLVSKRTEN